jgi:WD40 repeat protein
VDAAAFDEQGKLIAAAHRIGDSRKIEIWETASGKSVRSFNDMDRNIQYLAFSPDGQMLAASTVRYPDNIRIWDLKTGTELPALKAQTQTSARTVFAFTRDSKALALLTSLNEIKLVDLNTRKELRVFQTPGGTLTSLLFNHNGKLLAGAFGKTIQQVRRS